MSINRRKAVTMSLITSMLLAMMFIGLNVNLTPVSAQTTTVCIDPTPVTVSPCDTFVVDVNVTNVQDLAAWEFNITFDPNLLNCIIVTEGPFLQSAGTTIFPTPIIDNDNGWIKAGCTLFPMPPPGGGAYGSGTLAHIEFHCEGPGSCPLHFKPPPLQTDLYDSTMTTIPHVRIDGSVIQVEIEEKPIHLHGPPLTPIHMNSNESLVPTHMHSQQGLIDPTMPYETYWHELYPEYCQEWILNSWEDNGDKILSPSDQIDMINIDTEEMRWYHVDRMTFTLYISSEPPECWYTPPYKPPFPDYAPAGMPDFDERQWGTYNWTYKGRWSHCGPTAIANSVWWLDSEYEWLYNPASPPPPAISDSFPLVRTYNASWDDHHPNNVQPLVEHLAWLMDCDGRRTGLVHEGTYVWDMEAGLAQYLSWSGVNPLGDATGDGVVDSADNQTVWNAFGTTPGHPNWTLAADIYPETVTGPGTADNKVDAKDVLLMALHWGETGLFYEHTVARPDFYFIEEEVERCQDVVLLLGFWQLVEMMDQYQEICQQCEHVDTYWISWQEFVPTATSLSRVEVKIARTQGESNMFPINMTIESPLGNVLTSKTLQWYEVPELPWCEAAWVSFDVPDIPLTPGQSYYIVLDSEPLAYHWCGANGNPYTPGESNFGADWDWTFRTFYQEWIREWGHYVTVAGVDSPNQIIYLSDPCKDAFESGLTPLGRVPIPHVHPPPEPPYITHNNASYVSHDGYNVTWEPCPGGDWSIVGYPGAEEYNVQIEYAVITSPRPQKMAIELKEPNVYDPDILYDPICTLWHEVWPDYSNVYHIIEWIDSDASGNLTYCDYVRFEDSEIWWHVDDVATDLILNEKIMDPRCTTWHELYPNYSNYHHVTSWNESLEDPYAGRLSPCDQIDMENLTDPDRPTKWYHVDRVTLTLNVSNIDYPEEFMFIEFKGPFEELYWVKTEPVCTLWHEVWPVYSEIYHITNWTDNCNGVLDYCDEISFDGGMTWWHVEDLAIDIILTEKMTNPVCTDWHALYPPEEYCNWYHIDDWEDNDDGLLSPCDQIKMTLQPDGPTEEYHVETVTLTLKVDDKYIEFEIGDAPVEDALVCMANPLYTLWHEVYPEFCGRYELTGWEDNCNGVLDYCDKIELTPVGALEGTWYHVEEVSWDMVVTKKVAPPPPEMYWKENYTDYAPSGVPDFDQRQDLWNVTLPGFWSWCAPTAVANSLWWMDSRYENSTTPPPTINNTFPLVSNYTAGIDDHDPANVVPFIAHLGYLMDTDGNRTGIPHIGTNVFDMQAGIAHYLSWTGVNPKGDVNGDGKVDTTDLIIVNASFGSSPGAPGPGGKPWNMAADIWPVTTGWPTVTMADNKVDLRDMQLVALNYMNSTGMFYEKTVPGPEFYFVEDEVERCEDVILQIGFYYGTPTGDWERFDYPYDHEGLSGHCVTVAGVNSTTLQIAISDPIQDNAEAGGPGRVLPPGIPHAHPVLPPDAVHNNASFVSHDVYKVNLTLPQLIPPIPANFSLVNYNSPQYPPGGLAVVEWAIIVSPLPPAPPPVAPEDLELYPREVVILGNATCTQWHELHPNKTNYYHLTSWEPGKVLSPHDQIDMYAIDYPPTKIYVSTDFVDPLSPICSEWFEEFPTPQWWHLSSWEDNNGDGYLSSCDQIDMTNMDTGEVVWFHVQFVDPPTPEPGPRMMHLDVKYWFQVDEVTIDLVIWGENDTLHWLDYKCGYWTFDPKNPICTKWNEIKPDRGRCWHLTAWYDFNMNDYIDMGDEIIMTPMHPLSGPSQYCIVKSATISLMLTPKPSPPVVPPPPVGPMYLESEISYDEFDLANPVCTTWHEILPEQGRRWHLSSWEDSLVLSPSDQIVLTLKDEFHEPIPGTEAEYHVDKLTVAMNITSLVIDPLPYAKWRIVKYEGSLKEFMNYRWTDPVSTQWHEVNPNYSRQWHLTYWNDTNLSGKLDHCDEIMMMDKETGLMEPFHVNTLSTDIYVTPKVHDVAVINVTSAKTVICQGFCGNITVTVENQGHYTETFNVTAYANTTVIGIKQVTLTSGGSKVMTFLWNTTGFAKGNYTLSAHATPVPPETDTLDNTYIDDWVIVSMIGDITGATADPLDFIPDGKVDMKDIATIARFFGQNVPPAPPECDITGPTTGVPDGTIDMRDVATAARHFGETDP